VLVATSGDSLGDPDVVDALLALLPLVDLVTPNMPEAARLTGRPPASDVAGLRRLAETLHARGARNVLVKGGHLDGAQASDVLFDGTDFRVFTAARVATRNSHGTGCTLSSAIAAYVARGLPLGDAVASAKDYLTGALRESSALSVGHGHGPVHHFWRLWRGQ
jgi:hydroxymethylpyrimidine kinase/phosphomethylpyrimidine kinase